MLQDALDFFTATAWSVVLGVIASFPVAMFIEWARKPRLYLHIALPSDQEYDDGGHPAQDTSRLTIISKMDIPPGEQEDLDLAVRCDDDSEAYGCNNESYWSGWKNKKWTLVKGRYIIEVTVRSAGQKVVGRFLLNNDHGRDQFRLEAI